MKTRSLSQAGFSLVEVVFALAVVVFCLISVMGLLALGVTTAHTSSSQTTATNILDQIASDLQAAPNITLTYNNNTNPLPTRGYTQTYSPFYGIELPDFSNQAGVSGVATPGSVPTGTVLYFSDDGTLTTKNAANAFYQVNIYITSAG